ncbi:MAG: SurA N-terminal domain-containing protein, partial [Lachnospiraceae bacterium]|nr:SurA N-terminal domain-containing protein [Lachnospiraceae bacterium]
LKLKKLINKSEVIKRRLVIRVWHRRLFNLIMVTIALMMLSGCGANNKVSESSFITINKENCSVEEYMVYLDEAKKNFEEIGGTDIWETDFDGRSAVTVAKESALNSMIAVKVSAQKARELNITLTQEEQQKALSDAQLTIEAAGSEPTDAYKEAVEKIMLEKSLYSKLKEATVRDYVISEAEYDAYCESYYDAVAMQMKKITVKGLFFFKEATAKDFYNKITNGEDFETIFQQNNETGENRVFLTRQKDLEGELAELIDTQVGFVSRPIELENVYGIFKVVNIAQGEKSEIFEKLREDYTNTIHEQIFSSELEKWTSAATISKDESEWTKIDIDS